MSSLAFSTPITRLCTTSTCSKSNPRSNLDKNIISGIHSKNTPHPPQLFHLNYDANQTLVAKRRELITSSVISLGFLNALILKPTEAEAAEGSIDCEFTTSPSGLAFCDKIVGNGPQASKGQLIKAHYVGKLETGKVFDSSYDRGKPLKFRIGVGEDIIQRPAEQVIKGWDMGILGGDGVPPMLAGGKRTLKLPPELGYGIRGAGCKGGSCIIPPDSVLLFDVEFIGKA